MREFDKQQEPETPREFSTFSPDHKKMEIDMSEEVPDLHLLFRLLNLLRSQDKQIFKITTHYFDYEDVIYSTQLRTSFQEYDEDYIYGKAEDMLEAYVVIVERVSDNPQEMIPNLEYIPEA